MRGLRIDWEVTEDKRLMSRFEESMSTQLRPGPDATPQEVLFPAFVSDFSRILGPLFPEVIQRKWLLCNFLWTLDEPEFFEKEETSQAVSELNAKILDEFDQELGTGDFWILTTGEHLVRISNHLCDSEATIYGFPESTFDAFEQDRQGLVNTEELKGIAACFCDIAFDVYEGIWGAFFADPRLLARTFYHCSELARVSEVMEGVGIDGDWLTRLSFTCPNLPVLLAAESPDD